MHEASSPRAREVLGGCTYTFVMTEQFLLTFDLESLQDLPDREQREYAGRTEG